MKKLKVVHFITFVALVSAMVLSGVNTAIAGDISHNSTFDPGIKHERHGFSNNHHRFNHHDHIRHHGFHGKHHFKKKRHFRRHNDFRSRHRFSHPLHRAYELRNGISTQLHPITPFTNPGGKFAPHPHHRHRFHR